MDNIFANASVMRGLKEVVKFFATNNGDYQRAMREFTALKNHNDADIFPTDGNGTIITGMSPKSWWQMHGASWPILQPIAIRVFSIGTSSSTSECNFSTWSHIWSNRANSLTFERAVKMVYIYACSTASAQAPSARTTWRLTGWNSKLKGNFNLFK